MGRKLNGKLILSLFLISLASVSQSSATDELEKTQPQQRLVGHGVPAGGIIQFAGDGAPDGWFICDGQRVDGSVYKDLYRVIGTKYTPRDLIPPRMDLEFCLPDGRGRVPVGPDDSNVLGSIGGEAEHTLTVHEMPAHSHRFSHDPGSAGLGIMPSGCDLVTDDPDFSMRDRYRVDVTLTGGSRPHNNMQPFFVVNHIIKY